MDIKINDIIAFAIKKNPEKIKYITRVKSFKKNGFDSRYRIESVLTDFGNSWYDVRSKKIITKSICKCSKQILINNEIPTHLIKEYENFEKNLLNQYYENAMLVKDYMYSIFIKETPVVGIHEDRELSIIKDGYGDNPLLIITKEIKIILDNEGYLQGNCLLSFKGRRYYNFKLPEEKREKDLDPYDYVYYNWYNSLVR